jgi:hypothetical protein
LFKRQNETKQKEVNIIININQNVNSKNLLSLILEIMRNQDFNKKYNFNKTVYINNIDETFIYKKIVLLLENALNTWHISYSIKDNIITLNKTNGTIVVDTNIIKIEKFKYINVNINDYDPEKFFNTHL